MKELFKNREDRILILINNGFTGNIETGKIYNRYGKEVNTKATTGYITVGTTYDGKTIRVLQHQFIYYLATGNVVEQIDHINQIKDDNRIINLRPATQQQNQWNRLNTTKGYYWNKKANNWQATIKVNGKKIYLGCFDTEDEARQAYIIAKQKYHII